MLPGTTTVIDQIMMTRPAYEAAIRAADQAVLTDPAGRNLSPMRVYLDGLLQIQINSISSP
jgi:hypothetical protein